MIEHGGAVYLGWVSGSPAGLVFGPVLGLLVAIYLGARLVLFATAWAATRRPAPPPDRDAAPRPEGVTPAV